MKRIICFVLVFSFAFALVGCGKNSETVLLSNDVCTVTRTGCEILVHDETTGAECRYRIIRTRNSTSNMAKENRVGNLSVFTGGSVIIISDDSAIWVIKFGH